MRYMFPTLITARQLQSLSLDSVRVFDCSVDLADPDAGGAQFQLSHIAGAVHADLNHDLSGHETAHNASGGRHPLPSSDVFVTWLRRQGLDAGMQAVVYDRQGANFCGRLWWMLKCCGHEAVAVLEGGLADWQGAGGATASGRSPAHPTGNFALADPLLALRHSAEFARRLGAPGLTLIDARASARFPAGPGGRPHPGRAQPPVCRQHRPGRPLQTGQAIAHRVRGLACRPRPAQRGAPPQAWSWPKPRPRWREFPDSTALKGSRNPSISMKAPGAALGSARPRSAPLRRNDGYLSGRSGHPLRVPCNGCRLVGDPALCMTTP
jgi:3-mercaptopyruvate sulfurtransferase SseA